VIGQITVTVEVSNVLVFTLPYKKCARNAAENYDLDV